MQGPVGELPGVEARCRLDFMPYPSLNVSFNEA